MANVCYRSRTVAIEVCFSFYFLSSLWEHCLKLCFTGRKRKYIEIKDDKKIKRQTNLDRQGPRSIANVCHLGPPPPGALRPKILKSIFIIKKKK